MQKIPWKKIPWDKVGSLAFAVGAPIASRFIFEYFELGDLLGGDPTNSNDAGSAESLDAHHAADIDGASKSALENGYGA
jgi:hypothetical protein